jgi:hypothetical protein
MRKLFALAALVSVIATPSLSMAATQAGVQLVAPKGASFKIETNMAGPVDPNFRWTAVVVRTPLGGRPASCYVYADEKASFAAGPVDVTYQVYIFGADHGPTVWNGPLSTTTSPFDRSFKEKARLNGRDERLEVTGTVSLFNNGAGTGPSQTDLAKVNPQPVYLGTSPNVPHCS